MTEAPPKTRRRRQTKSGTPWRNRIVGLRYVDPRDLVPHPENYRIHGTKQQTALAGAIAEIGYLDPITAQEGTNLVIDGHLRVAEAIKNGETAVAVIDTDLNDDEVRIALSSIDPIGNLADHDREMISALLARIRPANTDLRNFYTDLTESEGIINRTGSGIETGTEDDIPEHPKVARSRPGDLWIMGDHRLLVGDATEPDDHERLMEGELADILVTDPPYGVNYQVGLSVEIAVARHRRKDGLELHNDSLTEDQTRALVADALFLCRLRPGAPFYLHSPAGPMETTFRLALTEAGLTLRQELIWVKQQFVMGRQDYHWRHESILYGWVDGAAHWFLADRTIDTVIDEEPNPDTLNRAELVDLVKQLRKEVVTSVIREDRPHRSLEHPTMKPVALITRLIYNSSRPSDILLDPFAGSGTCFIAGELTGRPTFGIEIDPGYADVCVKRWEDYTGETATRADAAQDA